MTVDELHAQMEARFEAVNATMEARFEAVNAAMEARFEAVNAAMEARFEAADARMKAEHEETRRHVDVAVEHFGDYVKMLAEGIAHNSGRLADHENRITALEVRERRE